MALGVALVVGCARSGTTLVQRVLDAHPEISAPREANILALVDQVGHTWRTLLGHPHDARLGELPQAAIDEVRDAALRPMQAYCDRAGSHVYCDKSLGTVDCLPGVADVFDEARYVLVHRHVMDVIASGLEASPWGFRGYGFQPFLERSIDNFVAGLAEYWTFHVSAQLQWEAWLPQACHRVRYEDLVREPARRFAGLFSFLNVDDDAGAVDRALATIGIGVLGDHKMNYTSTVHANSVGRGRSVPVALISPAQRDVVNACLAELGYSPLTDDWNTTAAWPEGHGADKP